jgi:hypothetical protein
MAFYINERREYDVQISGITTAELDVINGDYVYFSLYGWPNEALLKKIKIYATIKNVNGKITGKILRSPGLVKSIIDGGSLSAEGYVDKIFGDSTGDPNADTWSINLILDPPLPVYDNTLSNQLHIYLESGGTDDSTQFAIEAIGTSIHTDRVLLNKSNAKRLWNVSLWRNNEATSTWTDITTEAINHYSVVTSYFNMLLANSSTPEYLYIGNDNPFNKVFFYVKDANTSTSSTINVEYPDPTGTWNALTVYDSTNSFVNGDDIPMSYPGSFIWETPVNWAKIKMPDTHGTPPDQLKRYWIRLSMDDISTNPTFYWIRPDAYRYIS